MADGPKWVFWSKTTRFWRLPAALLENEPALIPRLSRALSHDVTSAMFVSQTTPKTIKWRPFFRRHFVVNQRREMSSGYINSSCNLFLRLQICPSVLFSIKVFKWWVFLCVAQFGGQFTNLVKFWVTGPLKFHIWRRYSKKNSNVHNLLLN